MTSIKVDKIISIAVQVDSININNTDIILKDFKKAALSHTDKDIVIDLKEVKFIDSSGLAMLVNYVQSLARTRRKMSIINATEYVKSTVKALNLTTFLNLR